MQIGQGVIHWITLDPVQTVAEVTEFIRRARRLLSEEEHRDLIEHLALHPRAGVLIPGTGGLRKLRWRRQDTGKRGGVRVIYYFLDEALPLYLLTVFAKNERSDLSAAEKKELSKLAALLARAGKEKRRHE